MADKPCPVAETPASVFGNCRNSRAKLRMNIVICFAWALGLRDQDAGNPTAGHLPQRRDTVRHVLIPARTIAKLRSLPAFRPRPTRRPAVEALEERLCLSGYLLVSSVNNSVLRYDEST